MERRFVVKHEHLSPFFKDGASSIVKARKGRLGYSAVNAVWGGMIMPVMAATLPGVNATEQAGKLLEANRQVVNPMDLVLFGAGGAAGFGLAAYGALSEKVGKKTRALEKPPSNVTHVDAAGVHKVSDVYRTHYGMVNRRGDLVFVPKTVFERGLKKAQATFLRHVIPARQRF